MVKKNVIYMITMFFVYSFFACSGNPSPTIEDGGLFHVDFKWSELPKGEPFPWDDRDGFYPHNDHPYGFDRHTKPRVGNKEDSTTYASIAERSITIKFYEEDIKVTTNEDGLTNLKINKIGGLSSEYNYYICNPEYPDLVLESIDNSKTEQVYKFTNDMENRIKKIALCRKDNYGGIRVMQELHIYTYDWRSYSFLPAYYANFGARNERNALVTSYEFWDGFMEVYKQAMIYSQLRGNILKIDMGNEVLTKVRGNYDNCPEGGIAAIRDEVIKMIVEESLANRVILQLGLPTKRFWPLKNDNEGNILICGNPDIEPSKDRDYDVVPTKGNCQYPVANIRWSSEDGKLYLKDGDILIPATTDNLNPECTGMAEFTTYPLGRQYVGEFSENTLARTWMDPGNRVAFTVLPWHDEDTKLIAYHELGHTMGLGDAYINLPGIDRDSAESDQGNIMFYLFQKGLKKGHKLRSRSVEITDTTRTTSGIRLPPIGNEKQWDCLRRESPEISCAIQRWTF